MSSVTSSSSFDFSSSEEIPEMNNAPVVSSTSNAVSLCYGYYATIGRLVDYDNKLDFTVLAFTQLQEAEAQNAFKEEPEKRADIFKRVIEKLIKDDNVENNLLEKACQLYKEAEGKDVWKDYPVWHLSVKQELDSHADILKQRGLSI